MTYTFQIGDNYNRERACFGDALSVNAHGDLRVRLKGKLVGYVKQDSWSRVCLVKVDDTPQNDAPAKHWMEK